MSHWRQYEDGSVSISNDAHSGSQVLQLGPLKTEVNRWRKVRGGTLWFIPFGSKRLATLGKAKWDFESG
ncbi:MAG: hypothetical protein AAF614_13905 [Chloroflexota bacterium]